MLKYNDFPNIIFFFYSSQNTLLNAIGTEVNKIIPKGVYILMERDISNLDFIIIKNCYEENITGDLTGLGRSGNPHFGNDTHYLI